MIVFKDNYYDELGKQNIVELDAVLQETATPIVFK